MKTALERALLHALKKARDHLDYCGYGDAWEGDCAKDSGLPDLIERTIAMAEKK